MDMEALRRTMYRIQEENDTTKENSVEKEVAASRAKIQKKKNYRNKCFRCNREGHLQDQCPLMARNQWACYNCNCITNHKSENVMRNLKRSFNNNNNEYEPPVKRNK